MTAPLPPRTPALVTVVVPCYRQAHFLGAALASVLAQTYSPIEVVVVDDGSPDDVGAVVESFPGVRLVRQANRGLGAARNAGLREARGAFLLFLDADDWLLPGAVEVGVREFARSPGAAFVAGGHRTTLSDGETPGGTFRPRQGGDVYPNLLRGNHIAMHGAVLYSRGPLKAAGGFDETLPACEDYDLYLRLARDHPAVFHDEVVAIYRRHGANMSGDSGLMLTTALRVLRRHRPPPRSDPTLMHAYRDGLQGWRRYYASSMFADVRRSVGQGHLKEGAGSALELMVKAPNWLVGSVARRALRSGSLAVRRLLPSPAAEALHRLVAKRRQVPYAPPPGQVKFGDLRRLAPISRSFGFDRGLPVDRHYIERFLGDHGADIRGRTLEIGDAAYTRRFGGANVERADVLHVVEGNAEATFVDDLIDGRSLPSDAFDCVVLAQTLHLIYDVRAAIATLHRILKPGGVLLVTAPGLSQIVYDKSVEEWNWGFTSQSMGRLLGETFSEGQVGVGARGNVLAATAFLHGLAASELTVEELGHRDPSYELVVLARAVKESSALPEGP